MAVDTKDTKGKKKFAFRDVRAIAQLLASGRPPQSIQIKKSNPVSKKLSKIKNKVAGATSKFLKSKATAAATTAVLGPVAGAFAAKLLGKVKLPGFGKLGGNISKVQTAASVVALGATIIEETNPDKIRRPLKEGLSASAAAMAKPLAETVAAAAAASLVSGAPLASGLPTIPRPFKTAASLVKSPRFFNPLNEAYPIDEKEKATAERAVKHVTISTPNERLYPQRGLLEDELMYRLTLLAENVYAPANTYAIAQGWGEIKILESFRAENSSTSQHELGEAVDITLGDGTLNQSARCFALAQWMRDHILYDQLILCFDGSGGGQVWIHASFRAEARRRQVLTKTFNDMHVEGLHLYQQATASDADVALQKDGEQFEAMLAARQKRLEPVGLDTVRPQELPNENSFGSDTSVGAGGDSEAATGPLVWAWYDLGGPPVRGNTLSGYQTEFFAAIGKSIGDPADDWATVLAGKFPANPAIGQQFDGIYQQTGSGGNVRGRLFLPTDLRNDAGYYFHEIDVLAPKP